MSVRINPMCLINPHHCEQPRATTESVSKLRFNLCNRVIRDVGRGHIRLIRGVTQRDCRLPPCLGSEVRPPMLDLFMMNNLMRAKRRVRGRRRGCLNRIIEQR